MNLGLRLFENWGWSIDQILILINVHLINITQATHAIVEEKFNILLKDHDKVNDIIRCSNELILDISTDSFCEVSVVDESGIELRVLYWVKIVSQINVNLL